MLRRRRPLLRAGMLAGTAYAAHEAGERSVQRQPAPAPTADSPLVAELTKLKGLLDAGALTPEEFTAAKQKLLAG